MSVFNKKFTITDLKINNNNKSINTYSLKDNNISPEDINNEIELFFPKKDKKSFIIDSSSSDSLTRTSSIPKIKKTVTFKLDTIKADTTIYIRSKNINCKCNIF
jgi:hypothetical protein